MPLQVPPLSVLQARVIFLIDASCFIAKILTQELLDVYILLHTFKLLQILNKVYPDHD